MNSPVFTMTAAAIKAAKWRANQKQINPNFAKQEAQRKADERAEVDRVQEVEDVLKTNPTNQNNSPFVMQDAPHSRGLLITGGYDSAKINEVLAASEAKQNVGKVTPKGWGSETFAKIPGEDSKETAYTFHNQIIKFFKKPREVRLLHQFIYENTKKSPMLVCLICREQIGTGETPREDIESGFFHFQQRHPEAFDNLVGRIARTACSEDHEGMVRRHGGGSLTVKCKRCKKMLYKPSKSERSDKV